MKALHFDSDIFNIQRCLLPDSDYIKKHIGQYVNISFPGKSHECIVQIGLCEFKALHYSCYVDNSVLLFPAGKPSERSDITSIDLNQFRLLPAVKNARSLEVSIIFNDITDKKKYAENLELLEVLIRDILQLFIVAKDSYVFLDNLPNHQKLNIYCIIVHSAVSYNNPEKCKADQIYRVVASTDIKIKETKSRLKFMQSGADEIKIGGCEKIVKALQEVVELSKSFNSKFIPNAYKKLLLMGPSGCGKTSLVENIARNSNSVLLKVLACDINTSLPGETEKKLREIFDRARLHAECDENCVILIDEIDCICMKSNDDSSAHANRTIQQLTMLLEEIENVNGIVVIATTNRPDEIDPKLKKPKAFDNELEIMIPTQSERKDIVCRILKSYSFECSEEIIDEVCTFTPGFVGADLQLMIQEALIQFKKTKGNSAMENELLLKNCFQKSISKITPTSLKGAIGLQSQKETSFSQIGGLDNIKKVLNYSVKEQLLHPEIFRRLGIPQTKGILLYGPPGCAKTTLVKALAKECNTTFLAVSAADLFSPFVGDAERLIVKLFSQARIGAPSIIFIDEIDALIGSKGDREKGIHERVLSALLVEMDGIGLKLDSSSNLTLKLLGNESDKKEESVIVIGATNRPELIDEALIRPGRFDKLLHVPCPNENERFQILQTVTRKMPLHESVNLSLIAKSTEYYSGADLKSLCYEAGLQALTVNGMDVQLIQNTHFQNVLSKSKSSLNPKLLRLYENFTKR